MNEYITKMGNLPRISAILIVSKGYETNARTIAALSAQKNRQEFELVFVVPQTADFAPPTTQFDCFHSWQIVKIAELQSVAQGYALGVRAASSPIVVFTEDHSFPEPDWGEALLAAYDQPYSVVGPTVYNANPDSSISWADFLLSYGDWSGPLPSKLQHHLPGHNSSYRRDVLLELKNLPYWLEVETVLHWELASRGHRLFLQADARTHHLNFAKLSVWSWVQLNGGRRFAAFRSNNWTPAKRLAFAAGSFLIPFVRLSRILPAIKRLNLIGRRFPFLFLCLLWGLAFDWIGQALGYLLGPGRSVHLLLDYEVERYRFI